MKSCPKCNRTFEDTLTYCLVDGAILSAPFDPHATIRIPEPRRTDPSPTEYLPPTVRSNAGLPSYLTGVAFTISCKSFFTAACDTEAEAAYRGIVAQVSSGNSTRSCDIVGNGVCYFRTYIQFNLAQYAKCGRCWLHRALFNARDTTDSHIPLVAAKKASNVRADSKVRPRRTS